MSRNHAQYAYIHTLGVRSGIVGEKWGAKKRRANGAGKGIAPVGRLRGASVRLWRARRV